MNIERTLVKAVARVAPWLAPIPSAYFVGRACLNHLNMSLPVAVITGLIIECLGLVAAYNWQWFSEWNRIKLKSDARAPAAIPAERGAPGRSHCQPTGSNRLGAGVGRARTGTAQGSQP